MSVDYCPRDIVSKAKRKPQIKSIMELSGCLQEHAKGMPTDWDEIREEAIRKFAEDFMRRKMPDPPTDESDESS